jgi:hypothetical protein
MPVEPNTPEKGMKVRAKNLNKRASKVAGGDKAAMAALLAEYDELLEEAKESDPFMYYEPSDGVIPESGREFLLGYLKEEDIPIKLDGQLDAHLCTADTTVVLGGNQSGKTTFQVIEDFIAITGKVPHAMKDVYPKEKLPVKFPVDVRVTGVSDRQVNNTVLKWYKYWCPKENLKNGRWKDSFTSEFDLLTLYSNQTGNKIIGSIDFMNNKMDVEVFQGPPKKKQSYDEEPKQDIRKENLRRFVTSDRVRETFAFTPTKGLSWTHDAFIANAPENGTVKVFQLCSVTNKKANLNALRGICDAEDDYEAQKMRLLGDFVSLSGLVYGSLFNNKLHVIPPFKVNQNDFIVYRGLDPHTTKSTVCVEVAVDREGNEYVCGTYSKAADTSIVKKDLADRAKDRNYRLGWTQCDTSANTTNHALGGRNIYRELSQGENAIPALGKSEKFTGSIHAGVDRIKQLLRPNEVSGKPTLYIFDIPENKLLITAMKTMEREAYPNEDKKGIKDKIAEGKHDAHAALRYAHQRIIDWIPNHEEEYEFIAEDYSVAA